MSEAVRRAAADDIPELARLWRDAIVDMHEKRGGVLYARREARLEPVEESLLFSLTDPNSAVWIGTFDDVPFGFAAAHVETLADGGRHGVIEELYVEPEIRAVGLGEAMGELIVAWCREQGCDGIDAHALPGDRNTKNFFEMSGFVARLLVMHHKLKEQ